LLVIPALASLIALQRLDSAAEALRRRLGELPSAEQEIETTINSASAAVEAAKTAFAENQQARRSLEKDVAVVDSRLSRFDDHKAAVKTNHEYTALLHEIATAKAEKDAVEEKILLLLEAADGLTADLKAAEAALNDAKKTGQSARTALGVERQELEREIARLTGEREHAGAGLEARARVTYDQLLKQRKGLAVARLVDGHCSACHVRLRPNVEQAVRRNDSIVQCDSCQRILYFEPPAQAPAATA